MKRVIVLGATGKVGRVLRSAWGGAGEICWLGRADEIPQAAQGVIACWGVTGTDPETLKMNTVLAERAAVLAERVGAARVLHFSSQAVYRPGASLAESAALAPQGAYGAAKLRMEEAVAGFGGAARHVCLRIGNVAGCDSLFRSLEERDAITLDRFGSGFGPVRSYIAAPELVAVCEALLGCEATALPDVVNVAAPGAVAMEDLARAAGREVIWRDAPAGALPELTLDVTRLQALMQMPEEASAPAHLVSCWRQHGGWA